jgi:8-oxo-dGTP pyrophosphatase MutT (NUDIX family)
VIPGPDGDAELVPAIPVSAGALIFDRAGRLLILKPTYKTGWTIPGGIMEADGETPWEACRREVREECGIEVRRARLACMDFRRPKPGRPGGIRFLFDCGQVGDQDLAGIVIQPEEVSEYRLAALREALDLLRGPIRRRVRAAAGSKRLVYLEDGRPVPDVGHGALADHQAERVPGRVAVDPPRYGLAGRAGAGRDVLLDQHGSRGQNPVLGRVQAIDQDVEVNPGGVLHEGRAGGLEGKPLAVRGRLERDPPRVPLHRRAAQEPGPEVRQCPRLGAVEHHFPDPADGRSAAHAVV